MPENDYPATTRSAASPGDPTSPPAALVYLAFASVYLLGGSTYLAIRFAIETLPPMLMASTRFLVAGGVLYGWLRMRGAPAPLRVHWKAAAIVGGLLLLGGNGSVVLAQRTVPSGLAALMVAMVPLWIVVLDWIRPGGTRPPRITAIGVIVGLVGMALLVDLGALVTDGRSTGGTLSIGGALLLLVAALAWSIGSLYSRNAPLPESTFLATAMEMIAGGALLAVVGLAAGEAATLDRLEVSWRSAAALGYLVVFGSLIGFTAYIWLLRVAPAAKVSTYAYVNPVIAVFLGWALADEPLTLRTLVAAAVIVLSVVLITSHPSAPRTTDAE